MKPITRLLPLALAGGLLVAPAGAEFTPVLSEIMASNGNTLVDEDGEFSDWIEIQNIGDSAGNLEGWSLSDDADRLGRWSFPNTALAPGEFLVVFASDKNRASAGAELHTNFKLKAGGEFLGLTRPGSHEPDSAYEPAFPQQYLDVSWGEAGYFATATPGLPNSAAGNAPIQAVEFLPDSQIFSGSLSIALANTSPGTTIIYTTDGSEPSSLNGTTYTTPFTITTTTEVRARAQVSDDEAGATTVRQYVRLAADTQEFSSPLPIIVLDNFAGGAVPQRNASTGPNGNDGSGVIQVARQPVLFGIFDRGESGQASPSDPATLVSYAGLRVRGSSSASLPKKSFSLETWQDGEQEQTDDIAPFDMPAESDWVLYAPTESFSGNRFDRPLLHNSFIYELSNQIGRYASRTQFVELFLNTGGGDLSMADYAGLYIFMERRKRDRGRIDFDPLSADAQSGGWMLNVDRMDPLPIGGVGTPRHFHTPGPDRILQTPNDSPFGVRNRDDRPEYYHSFFNFESPGGYQINGDQRGLIEAEMNAFEDALYGPDWRDPATGYAAHIDVDSFVDQFILQNLTKNQDAFVLSTLLYRDSLPDKIKFGPIWDFDRGYTTSPTNPNPAANLRWAADRMWFPRLFSDPDFEQRYIDRWQQLRSGAFSTDNLHAIIDSQAAEITETVAARNGTANWPSKVAAMKNWLAARTAAIDAPFVPRPTFSTPGGAVPAGFELTLNGSAGTAVYYTTDGSDPRLPGGGISPNALVFQGGPVDSTVVPYETPCRYHIPTDGSLGSDWTQDPGSFDDSAWTSAQPGFGWENLSSGTLLAAVNTDLKSEMRYVNASGFFRWQFEFDNAANINSLTLKVLIDDGFVAYLNGSEIGRFHAPDPLTWDAAATDDRPDSTVLSTPVEIDATPHKALIRNGSNALAIQAMNLTSGGADFLVDASLELNQTVSATPIVLDESQTIIARAYDGGEWSSATEATFAVGTTPAGAENLVVSEIMYHPAAPTPDELAAGILDRDQFEFIELMNIGASDIDLSGVTFADGIDFTFRPGLSSVLEPGGRVLVLKDRRAFEQRYGDDPSRNIAGEFANDTNLRNGGERISILTVGGQPVRGFEYDDDAPWPESPDGGGYSLVLQLPSTNPDHGLASSWHSSPAPGGSPGQNGGDTFAGEPSADADGDGLGQLIEFATGTSDQTPSASPTRLEPGADGSQVFTFRRNLAASGIRYVVESSRDLTSWEPDGELLGETNLGDGTATVRYGLGGASSPRRYVRLRVDLL